MPLSEDEERILLEIEENLYESDPELAREVSETTVYTKSLKNLKWSVLIFFSWGGLHDNNFVNFFRGCVSCVSLNAFCSTCN